MCYTNSIIWITKCWNDSKNRCSKMLSFYHFGYRTRIRNYYWETKKKKKKKNHKNTTTKNNLHVWCHRPIPITTYHNFFSFSFFQTFFSLDSSTATYAFFLFSSIYLAPTQNSNVELFSLIDTKTSNQFTAMAWTLLRNNLFSRELLFLLLFFVLFLASRLRSRLVYHILLVSVYVKQYIFSLNKKN